MRARMWMGWTQIVLVGAIVVEAVVVLIRTMDPQGVLYAGLLLVALIGTFLAMAFRG